MIPNFWFKKLIYNRFSYLESSEILFLVVIARNEMTACPEILFRKAISILIQKFSFEFASSAKDGFAQTMTAIFQISHLESFYK